MRGTALVETALTLGFTLMMVLGAVQIATMGFYQMQLDGATFFVAHNYSAGSTNTTSLEAALQPLFPNVSFNFTPVPTNPPLTNVPVNFTQWGQLQPRYGGASILRPQRTQVSSSMKLNWLSVLGNNNVTISSGSVDGKAMIGNHDMDAQGVAFDSPTAYTTMVDPLSQDDQNVPPYYSTLAFIWYCGDTAPWGPTCHNRTLRSLGLAEYLKDDNYQKTLNGTQPGGVFETIACHQRVYANLAAAFPASMPAYSAGGNYDLSGSGTGWNGVTFQTVYNWDVMPVRGENGAPTPGRLYPLPVTSGC